MTGDETVHDALLDGPTNYFLDPRTYMNSGQDWNSRAIGAHLMGAARLGLFLNATGDPADGTNVLSIAANNPYALQVVGSGGPLCVSGYPAGCAAGTGQGVSATRGLHYINGTDNQCTGGAQQRAVHTFMEGILLGGLWEFRQAQGPTWPEYTRSLDLAYGVSQWMLSEGYANDGTGVWTNNGFRYNVQMDVPNNCGAGEYAPQANETVWLPFLVQNQEVGGTSWQRLFNEALQQEMSAAGMSASDFGQYQIGAVINVINQPGANTLQSQPISGLTDNGGGNYTISWIVPSGAQSYRIKWGQKAIVDWIGFDPTADVFLGNPATTMNWFAATEASNIPVPGVVGSNQSLVVSTGVTGLTAANFSVKAFVPGTVPSTGAPASLTLVSGNGQTAMPGHALSTPFTVEVSDINGNGVAGVSVTFTVTAGGGTLTAANALTNSSGLASSTLTLGPNAGANTVSAVSGTLAGSPLVLSATGVAVTGPASNIVLVSGNSQTGSVGQQLTNPFTVMVTDANGSPVSGVTVAFGVTAGGGTLMTANVLTNSSGLASSTLTLGPSSGTNTVTAASGTLTGSPVVFTATATAAPSGAVTWIVGWTNMTYGPNEPGFNYWLTDFFDPASQQIIHYGIRGNSDSIYSSDIFFYSTVTKAWTHLGGNGSLSDSCPTDTASWPGDRHPLNQMAVDTKRNLLWLWGGVCQGNGLADTYYLQLNANPMTDTWHKVNTQYAPAYYGGSGAYDPDDDVLFHYGYDGASQASNNWVYCSTIGNPTAGVLTAKQSAAGCAIPDDWTQIVPVGGVQPPGSFFAGMLYDTVTKKVLLYGGLNSGLNIAYNQTWAYDVPTRIWKQRALSTTPPPVYTGQLTAHPAWAYNSNTNKVLYHQTSNAGAPADWQYDPVADTWTMVGSGGGPTGDSVMSYDSTNNQMVTFSYCGPGCPQVWQGSLGVVAPVITSRCDLNGDGIVNIVDVQLAIEQVLGANSCGTADLIGNGVCSVIDVQRIINASLGGTCRTGF